MASQVDIPSSFGFILRDRNHRYDENAVVLQKNLKDEQNLVDSWIETQNLKNKNKNKIRLKEKSEESKRNDKIGASSLVQIWEARVNRNSPSHGQLTASSNRSDSGLSELTDEFETNPDPTVEIESDSGESKWGRVANLIRKLSNEENFNAGENSGCGGGLSIIRTPRPPCVSSCSSSEKNSFFPVVNFSPRIRGRQAFTDLLMQLERDRHRELESLHERNAVSRFTQRGRLQSMLRLRDIKRSLAIQDRNRSNAKTTATGLNRVESGSTVLHLREKFRAKVVNAAAASDQRKDLQRSAAANKETVVTRESTWLKKKGGETPEAFFAERLSLPNRKIEEEATICKEEETVESEINCLELHETIEAEEAPSKEEEKTSQSVCLIQELRLRQNQEEEKMENSMQETLETQTQSVLLHESNLMDQCLEDQEAMNQCLETQESLFLNGWEEYEDEQSYYGETNNDWLSEISRPRSYWEDLRKSRYLEVMNTRSEKEDIRRLLERRTVSDFLESGLRVKIDNLMMSHVQTHSNKHTEKWELQEEEEEENETEEETEEEQEPLTELEEQDDRDDSSIDLALSPAGSWSSQDSEVTSTPALSHHNPPHHSSETDLISGMRSQMQQLQKEMSLLRDAVKTCLDANASLQQSVNRENPLKRKCCVCDDTQVEAVLYKCGHMCTCLKCANELHWSGGKCPICRAHILDVVRVFFDTRN